MIRRKLHIKDRIESISTMSAERWKEFDWQHIADIGEVLGYLLDEIQKLENSVNE